MQPLTLELVGNKTLSAKGTQAQQERNKLFFDVSLHNTCDVVSTDLVLPHLNKAVMVQTPNGSKLVNICSDQYALVKLENILLPFEKLLDEHFEYSATYRHQDHSKFFIDYVINTHLNTGESLHKIDTILPKISIQHSYTGTLKFACTFGFYRLVCTNGLTVPVGKGMEVQSKHTRGSLEPTIREMFSGVEYFVQNAHSLTSSYAELQVKKVFDLPARIEQASKATGFPQKLGTDCVLRATVESKKLGLPKTDWLAYNAMNYQLNHNYTNFGMQPAERLSMDSKVLEWFLNN